jgi:hypothetical protein
MKASLFCLLVLLASVDDLLALSTPEADDDLVAAGNNEYLAQPRAALTCPGWFAPALACPPEVTGVACLLPYRRGQRADRGCLHPGANPLYALLSLQQ